MSGIVLKRAFHYDAPRGSGVSDLYYISISYCMPKGKSWVQIECNTAYVINRNNRVSFSQSVQYI